jgi:hypothetical protein
LKTKGPSSQNASLNDQTQTVEENQDLVFNFEVVFEAQNHGDETYSHPSTLITSVQTTNNTPIDMPKTSLTQRLLREDFHFEPGESSHNPNSLQVQENRILKSSFAQFHLEPPTSAQPLTQLTCTDSNPDQTQTVDGLSNSNEAHYPGPPSLTTPQSPQPHTELQLSLSQTLDYPPNSIITNPYPTHQHHHIPKPPTLTTQDLPCSKNSTHSEHTESTIPPIKSSSSSHKPRPRKRFWKEIGKLGRNHRHKIFCGLFNREISGNQDFWEDDTFISMENHHSSPPPNHNF